MGRLRKVNKRVPAQRGTTDQAALDGSATPLPAPTGQGAVDRVRWPWLLSDRGILAAVLLVAGLGVAALVGMWLIAGDTGGAERAKLQIEALKYGLGFTAAAGAVAALLLAVRRQRLAEDSHQLAERSHVLAREAQAHTERDAAERRVTDLYGKAVEQLGHADAAVRLGGLYALERVAQSNPGQRQTVVNVLCAYLRMPYTPPATTESKTASAPTEVGLPIPVPRPAAEGRNPHQELQVRSTAQRILTSHLRLPDDAAPEQAVRLTADPQVLFWPHINIDLTGAHLVDWDLSRGQVQSARFGGATFTGDAWFGAATFSGIALFDKATFSRTAGFSGATFTGDAWFGAATFSGFAKFDKATFTGSAGFDKATFSVGAAFAGATFSGDALFGGATFSGDAWFGWTTFTGTARFIWATFTGPVRFDKATFTGPARFGGATFSGDALFGGATFNSLPMFSETRVGLRSRRVDHWPSGWAVALAAEGQEFGTLVHEPAAGQAGAAPPP